MKSNYSAKTSVRSSSSERLQTAGFSRRLARPSLGLTVASLRLDDLWDGSFLDRLQPPLTRRHY